MRIVQLLGSLALVSASCSTFVLAAVNDDVAVVRAVKDGTCNVCPQGHHESSTALHKDSRLKATNEIRCDGKAKLIVVATETRQELMFNDSKWNVVGHPGAAPPYDLTRPIGGGDASNMAIEQYYAQWTPPNDSNNAGASEGLAMAQATSGDEASSHTILASKDVHADRQLSRKVRAALAKTKGLSVSSITVRARGGAVTLQGSVPEQPAIDMATQAAQGVAGVTSVKNALTIRSVGQ
jgi:hyperosmotically inducible protein